jgi:hypothetical protein
MRKGGGKRKGGVFPPSDGWCSFSVYVCVWASECSMGFSQSSMGTWWHQRKLHALPVQGEDQLETGDIILVRQLDFMPYATTHPGITRGMISHMKGHFDTDTTVDLDGWTAVGVVYRNRADRDYRRRKKEAADHAKKTRGAAVKKEDDTIDHHAYVIMADRMGVQIWSYMAFLRHSNHHHHVVVCRRLEQKAPETAAALSFVELDEFYAALLPVGISWLSCRGKKYKHHYIQRCLANTAVVAKQMPRKMKEELNRYFLNLDVHSMGYLDAHAVKDLLRRTHGDISDNQVKILMNAIDANHDGIITQEEFVEGFAKRPLTEIPHEHSFCSDTGAELVALIYEDIGLLQKRKGTERHYSPQSFASEKHRSGDNDKDHAPIVLLNGWRLSHEVSLKFHLSDGSIDGTKEDRGHDINNFDAVGGLDDSAGESFWVVDPNSLTPRA